MKKYDFIELSEDSGSSFWNSATMKKRNGWTYCRCRVYNDSVDFLCYRYILIMCTTKNLRIKMPVCTAMKQNLSFQNDWNISISINSFYTTISSHILKAYCNHTFNDTQYALQNIDFSFTVFNRIRLLQKILKCCHLYVFTSNPSRTSVSTIAFTSSTRNIAYLFYSFLSLVAYKFSSRCTRPFIRNTAVIFSSATFWMESSWQTVSMHSFIISILSLISWIGFSFVVKETIHFLFD